MSTQIEIKQSCENFPAYTPEEIVKRFPGKFILVREKGFSDLPFKLARVIFPDGGHDVGELAFVANNDNDKSFSYSQRNPGRFEVRIPSKITVEY